MFSVNHRERGIYQMKSAWNMCIPVINWSHVPSTSDVGDLGDLAWDSRGEFVIVYVRDEIPGQSRTWIHPLIDWLRANYGQDAAWVRFDPDGDIIAGLPRYDCVNEES